MRLCSVGSLVLRVLEVPGSDLGLWTGFPVTISVVLLRYFRKISGLYSRLDCSRLVLRPVQFIVY
jgi:hypothetical protein